MLVGGATDSDLRCECVGTFEGGGLRFLGCEVTGRTLPEVRPR